MNEIESIKQEIAELEIRKQQLQDDAWKARTFTARDDIFAEMKNVDLMIMNLQWKIEYIEAKEAKEKYKAEHPEEVEEEKSSEPAPEGTVESILEFFGE